MSLKQGILHGKEYRENFRGTEVFTKRARSHGSYWDRKGGIMRRNKIKEAIARKEIRENS